MVSFNFQVKLEEVRALISRLSIDGLNNQWVQNTIDSDFTEVYNLPSEFEDLHVNTNFQGLLNAIICALRDIIDSIQPDTTVMESSRRSSLSFLSTSSIMEEEDKSKDTFSKFWINLSDSFNIKALMSLLFFFAQRGQTYDANEKTRELGIQAASFYFLLLSLPGSKAFRVYHPMLYLKALEILKLTTKLNVGSTSPKKNNQRSSKSNHRQSTEDEGIDDEDGDISLLSIVEASKLTRSLNILLNDFLRFIKKFSLKHCKESLDETIAILVNVTRCEIHNAQDIFINRHSANTSSSLAYNSYVAIQNICDPLHGSVKKNIGTLMKYMMNNILMTYRGSSDLSTRSLGVIREHSITFVKYLSIQLKEITYEAIYVLAQHLCYKVPDKADYREKAAKSVIDFLNILPIDFYAKLLKWLYKFSHNDKAGHRLFTLEVISKLLAGDERHIGDESISSSFQTPALLNLNEETQINNSENFNQVVIDNSVAPPQSLHVLSHKFLLSIIFSRCRDSAATVRSKALQLLADCTLSGNQTIIESMKQIFFNKEAVVCVTPHIAENQINCESPQDELTQELELPNAEMIMSMLKRRALDDKVTVRKSALQVVENLMKMDIQMLSTNNLKIMIDHCRDPALFIRKQVITSFTTITELYSDHDEVVKSWVKGILPLILDPELKVQEKVVENVHRVIFEKLEPRGSPCNKLPWNALKAITELSFHKFLNKILMFWSKSEFCKPSLVRICKSHVGYDYNEQAWTLLALLSQYITINDAHFALDYFEENCNFESQIGTYTLQQVLKVLRHSNDHIPSKRRRMLQETLLQPIVNLSVNVELVSPMIDTVTHITYSLETDEVKGVKAIEAWAAPLLKSCDDFLKKMLFPKTPAPLSKEEEELFFRYLYTLGDVAQLLPSKVNKRMFLMLQSIIFHQSHSNEANPPPSGIPSSQTQRSQPPSITFTPTRRLKALAVVTLGKMCLQHEDQAKRIIPALGKLLDTTCLPTLKINIIFLLSDMCVRYATLVDPLMPQVTLCLRDSDVQVRRTTLTLLITLLQEDYLKLKGSFFYRILQCLSDENEEIRSTVIFYMTERLLKRFPKIFLQHFIECIFHYNCYEDHESYNKFAQSTQEMKLFSLAGAHFREHRMDLYRFMLDHMPDDQRFATTQRLCEDVLGGVVDGRIKLTSSSLPMLEDTLMVLSSEEIKLAWLKSRPEDMDQPTDQIEQAEMAKTVVKKTIISQDRRNLLQLVKKNVIENVIPILIALKQKLAEHKSPLTKQLLLYFKELMKDYKNEVKEILAGEKHLIKEIEFDLRKFDEQKQREDEETAASAVLAVAEVAQQTRPSTGQSPKLNVRKLPDDEVFENQIDDNNIPSIPAITSATMAKPIRMTLLKQALFNSCKLAVRSSSIATSNSEEERLNEADKADDVDDDKADDVDELPSVQEKLSDDNFSESGSSEVDHSAKRGIATKDCSVLLKKVKPPNDINADVSSPNVHKSILEKDDDQNSKASEEQMLDRNEDNDENCSRTSEETILYRNKVQEQNSSISEQQNLDGNEDNGENCSKTSEDTILYRTKVQEQNSIISPEENVDRDNDEHRNSVPFTEPERDKGDKNDFKKPKNLIFPKIHLYRDEILRAISTPHQDRTIINNITFINKTQELSAIGINMSEAASFSNNSSSQSKKMDDDVVDDASDRTLLVHFKSPKDDQFSRLRKSSSSTRRKISKSFVSSKEESRLATQHQSNVLKETKMSSRRNNKRSAGGLFMESFEMDDNDEEHESSSIVGVDSSSDFSAVSPPKKERKMHIISPCKKKQQNPKKRNTKKQSRR